VENGMGIGHFRKAAAEAAMRIAIASALALPAAHLMAGFACAQPFAQADSAKPVQAALVKPIQLFPSKAAASATPVPVKPSVTAAPAKPPVAATPAAPAKPPVAATPATPAKPAVAATATAAAPAVPAAKPAPVRVSEAQKEFCNLVWNCTLPMPNGYCPDRSLVEKPDFTFDSTRCLEARTLTARGIGPGHPLLGFRLYRFLGMEYRVIYTVEDDLPISEARFAFLLADLPLAAHLIEYFQKEPYTARYVDAERKHFEGTKGKHLKGDATLISGSSDERRLFYFGYGVASVAWWTLRGPALMDFTYVPSTTKDKNLHYKMKLLVFPGNGVINGIMNLGLFKKVVYSKIREVLDDITKTGRKLATGSAGILVSKDWTPEEKKKIEAFLKLP
jgi:hypothetical protein